MMKTYRNFRFKPGLREPISYFVMLCIVCLWSGGAKADDKQTYLKIKTTNVITDLQTLQISGQAQVTLDKKRTEPAQITLFEDVDYNGQFDADVDNQLGVTTTIGQRTVDVPVAGTVLFRDSPIYASAEYSSDTAIGSTAQACRITPKQSDTLDVVLKWEWTKSAILPYYNQVMSTPVVAPVEDTNEDGKINDLDIPAVIFHTFAGQNYFNDGVLRAVSGKDGRELWTVTDSRYRTGPAGQLAVADIDQDGFVEILAPKSGGNGLFVFEHDGTFKWNYTPLNIGLEGGASTADLDNDGSPEIIVGRTVLNANGTLKWQGNSYIGENMVNIGPLSTVADINLDGQLEVVAGAAVYSSKGVLLWKNTKVGDGFVGLGNFNADDYPEIVVVRSGTVSLLDHTGKILWGHVYIPHGGYGGAPTIADMDGDGEPEIGVAGASRYVVFNADGSLLWQSPTNDASSNITGSSVFDFEGDGHAEVIYADEQYLRVYRGSDGKILFQTPNSSGTGYELPVIADIDNDNHADIVICANNTFFPGNRGIRVFQGKDNDWVNTRKIWNQHTYHITNINDDGTVPRFEQSSWLTHNTFRLNMLAQSERFDVSVTSVPDLTASQLYLTEENTLRVRIGNAGAIRSPDGVTVSFYAGYSTDTEDKLLGTVTLGSIPSTQYQDIVLDNLPDLGENATLLYAFVDSGEQVTECNETNNMAWQPLNENTTQYPFNEGTNLRISYEDGLLSANGFPDFAGLTVELGDLPAHGELHLKADGSYQYFADNLHCGDEFTYRVCGSNTCSAYQSTSIKTDRADLVLSDLRHQDNTLSINVKNDGIISSPNTHISFYQFDAEQGGTLLGTAPVKALAPNQQDTVTFNADNLQEPLNVYAVIDAENQLDECNKINNSITLFSSETEGVTPASCEIYGMDDREQNNSQLFSLRVKSSFKEFEHNQLATCVGCDLETLTSHPQTRVLYTASSDNTAIGRPKGYLYRIDAKMGTFLPVGSTGFDDIEGLAFSADGILYGYAKGHGIIDIDPLSGKSTLIVPSTVKVEGFTLDNENPNVFYGAVEKALWRFDRTAEEPLKTVCNNLPGEVESLRLLSKELVLLNAHNQEGLQVFNVETCQLAQEAHTPTPENEDIEGLTLVGNGCATLARLLSSAHDLKSYFLYPLIAALSDENILPVSGLPFPSSQETQITVVPFEKRDLFATFPNDDAVPSAKPLGVIPDADGEFAWVFKNEQGQIVEQPLYQLHIVNECKVEDFFRAVPNFKKLVIQGDGNVYYTIGRSMYHSALDTQGGIQKSESSQLQGIDVGWIGDVNGDKIEDVEFTYPDGSKQVLFMFGKIGEVTE